MLEKAQAYADRDSFERAINQYNAARGHCPDDRFVEINGKVLEVFKRMNALREQAEALKRQAIKDKDAAVRLKNEADRAKKDAQELAARNQRIIDASYFYADRFGLAVKFVNVPDSFGDLHKEIRFGYIDKEGNTLLEYEFEEALPFNERSGFAQVKNNGKFYLVDTIGNTFPLTFSFDSEINYFQALVLREQPQRVIPNEFAFVPEVKILLMDDLGMGALPKYFEYLEKLEYVVLSGNGLVTLPDSFGRGGKIRKLDLSQNSFYWPPMDCKYLSNIEELNLSENKISAIGTRSLICPKLIDLDLSWNFLWELSDSAICNLASLKRLDLSSNYLEYLPDSLGNLRKIEELYLSDNKIQDLDCNFMNMKSLRIVDLSNNNLVSCPQSIVELPNLTSLFLSGNLLASLPSKIWRSPGLKILDLTGCHLGELGIQQGDVSQVEEIFLGENDLKSWPLMHGNFPQLKVIDLSDYEWIDNDRGNNIQTLPSYIGEFSLLRTLRLGKLGLSKLPNSIGRLNSLSILDLSQNEIHALPTEFGNLESLIELNLSFNSISLLPTTFKNLSTLRILHLEGNELGTECLSTLTKLSGLREIYLGHNPLSENEEDKDYVKWEMARFLPNCKVYFD